ncbi:MAG: hypothetical protein WCX71_05095 [Candidatus Buchananbacteria bacterium]
MPLGLGKKIFAVLLTISFFIESPVAVMAQQEMPPEAAAGQAEAQKQGPSEAEIAQFESEFGAPPTSFADNIGPTVSSDDGSGRVPDFVKQYAGDEELVKIYCAMVRWKSGDFFSAMDAISEFLNPPMEKVKALGIDVFAPDTAGLKAEGEKRLGAICAAKTFSEAEKLGEDFKTWSMGSAKDFSKSREQVQLEMKKRGDEMRNKVKTQLEEFVNEEKKKIQEEIEAEVSKIVEAKKSQIQAEAQQNLEMGTSGFAVKKEEAMAEITSAIQAKVDLKKTEMQAKVKAKVEEIIGVEKKAFEDIGKEFSSVGSNIDNKIKSRQGEYLKYRDEAFALRQKLVLKILDKNVADGLAQLDAAQEQIELAKKEDPSIKSVAEIKTAILAERGALAVQLNAALEAGDENGFTQALDNFRNRWESYRTEMEKVSLLSMNQACQQASSQFGSAKSQMAGSAKKIRDLADKCSNQVTDECLQINEFAGRFSAILEKFDAMNSEISLAEKMCENVSAQDSKQLMAMFKKIQQDAEDLKIFGQALEADKQKAIADSATKVCGNVLSKIKAVIADLESTDVPVFENNLKKCQSQNTSACQNINSLAAPTKEVLAGFKEFKDGEAKVRTICLNVKDENDIQAISVILNSLKDRGEELKVKAKNLKVELSEKASAKAFCRATKPMLGIAKAQVANGLKELVVMENNCKNNKSTACANLPKIKDKILALRDRSVEVNDKIKTLENDCKNPDAVKLPGDSLIDAAEYVRDQETELKKMLEEVKASFASSAAAGQGIWIEAESAVKFNTRLGVSNPMAREVNPSWRPPYSGSGTWYMGAGNDFLEYNIAVPADGRYNVWVRDYVDNYQPRGVRRIKIFFDGNLYGTFGETAANILPGQNAIIAWHQVGTGVSLKMGSHSMKVVKESTTAGAAILDAFYLTTNSQAPTQQ